MVSQVAFEPVSQSPTWLGGNFPQTHGRTTVASLSPPRFICLTCCSGCPPMSSAHSSRCEPDFTCCLPSPHKSQFGCGGFWFDCQDFFELDAKQFSIMFGTAFFLAYALAQVPTPPTRNASHASHATLSTVRARVVRFLWASSWTGGARARH